MGFGGISSIWPHLSVPPLSDGGRAFSVLPRPYDSALLPKRPQKIHRTNYRDTVVFLEPEQVFVS